MVGFRATWTAIEDFLKSKAEALEIAPAKIKKGDLKTPGSAPFIHVYVIPSSLKRLAQKKKGSYTANVLIFCGCPPQATEAEAIIASTEFALKVYSIFFDEDGNLLKQEFPVEFPDDPVEHDEIAAKYTCASVEFTTTFII